MTAVTVLLWATAAIVVVLALALVGMLVFVATAAIAGLREGLRKYRDQAAARRIIGRAFGE